VRSPAATTEQRPPSLPGAGCLDGLRVIELSSFVATPLCGMVLSQLGAEVIRVEHKSGSPDRDRLPRSPEGRSLYWAGLNKGKRGIAVDLDSAEGRELVARLIVSDTEDTTGGIVVSNSDRYAELGYAALARRRPDVIHVLLNGMRDGSPTVDYVVQATTGFPFVQGPEDSARPSNSVVPAWDIASGLYLAIGILAAERQRRLTGEGTSITVSLEDVALATAGSLGYLAEAQLTGVRRASSGNEVYGTFGRDFVSADGVRFMLVVVTHSQWRKLVAKTGLTEAMAAIETALGANFGDEGDRYRCRRAISALLENVFTAMSWEEIRSLLSSARILVGAYRSWDDMAADDASPLRANPLFSMLHQRGVETPYLAAGLPMVVGGRQVPAMDAPAVGQHTDEVLSSVLGLAADQVAALRADGVLR
jgi:2-methylfumaryl-CoA isomerase